MQKNVSPYASVAWIDEKKTKIGYQILFTRHFYKYVPPRKSEEIFIKLKSLSEEETELMKKLLEDENLGTVALKPWNDSHDQIRFQILIEVYQLVCHSFGGDYIKNFDLSVQSIDNKICTDSDEIPCTHYDRSMICITAKSSYWCKFIHQISHELCHCITSRENLPQGIRWFDEFLCCFASYFVEKNDCARSVLGGQQNL